jgi:hypothetical protein
MPAPVVCRSWFLAAAVLFSAAPARADFRMEKQLPLPPGGAFTLETEVGAVTVVGDSAADVFAVVTSQRDDLARRMDFRFDARTGAVRVRATRRSHLVADWLRNWGWNDRLRFEVHVPRRTGVAVQTAGGFVTVTDLDGGARIRTSGGALRLQNIAGDVEARTSGGPVHVQDVRGSVLARTSGGRIDIATVGGRIEASTSGGPIRIDASRADVSARTSGGGIHVNEAGGRVEARTSGGPILVRFAPGNGHGGALHTSGGSVHAAIDPATAVSIDAASSGGRVTSDLAVRTWRESGRYALRGDLNGGGPTLQVRTSGGPVRVLGLGR